MEAQLFTVGAHKFERIHIINLKRVANAFYSPSFYTRKCYFYVLCFAPCRGIGFLGTTCFHIKEELQLG
jgi:hypothetical protein